jgi:hypothetical protein
MGLFFRVMYRLLRWLDPLIRRVYGSAGIGNVHELIVRSRRTGRERSLLLTLLRARGALYIGHPNGWVPWTRDLEAAGEGALRWQANEPLRFRPVLLPTGPEREVVIRATWSQQPFPANLIYSMARRHIRRVGVYFRLEPLASLATAAP